MHVAHSVCVPGDTLEHLRVLLGEAGIHEFLDAVPGKLPANVDNDACDHHRREHIKPDHAEHGAGRGHQNHD